jgi:hypothetical protein
VNRGGSTVDEKIYFNEKVKGHKLLVTSRTVAFERKQLNSNAVDSVSEAVFKATAYGIPYSSSLQISISAGGDAIWVQCATFGGLLGSGQKQHARLRAAVIEAAGLRLISDALRRLRAGEQVTFEHKAFWFGKHSRFTLSRHGVNIEQKGIISRKALVIEWQHLRIETFDHGVWVFRCYSTRKKAAVPMWRMSNNIVFHGLLQQLVDRANWSSPLW